MLPPRAESLGNSDSEMQTFESSRLSQPVRLQRVLNRTAADLIPNAALMSSDVLDWARLGRPRPPKRDRLAVHSNSARRDQASSDWSHLHHGLSATVSAVTRRSRRLHDPARRGAISNPCKSVPYWRRAIQNHPSGRCWLRCSWHSRTVRRTHRMSNASGAVTARGVDRSPPATVDEKKRALRPSLRGDQLIDKRCNNHRRIVGCMRSELGEFIQWSWVGRPAIALSCPGPSMIAWPRAAPRETGW